MTGLASARAAGWLLLLACVILWELSARFGNIGSSSWPPFSDVVRATISGLLSGELLTIIGSTLWRMAAGYVSGSALGILLGLLIGTTPILARALRPLLEALRPLPIPAIVPPLILFLGIDDRLKITVVAFAVFFPVLLNTMAGVAGIDPVISNTARTFGKSRLHTLVSVVIPAALPAIFAGLRISLSLALITTIVAEMIAGSGGLGYYILETQYAMRSDRMYSAVLCLALIGYALNWAIVRIERKALFWYTQGA